MAREGDPEDSNDVKATTVVVGIVSDPGTPAEVVDSLAEELPDDLDRYVSDTIKWVVRWETHPLQLDESGNVPIVGLAKEILPSRGWDLLVFVTDLPRRLGVRPVVADMSVKHGVALASLPALGAVWVRRRLRDTLVYLTGELGRSHAIASEAGRVRHRAGGRLTPVHWVDNPTEEIEAALALVGWRGRLRLLLGMVRDNKPWRLVPELSTALAAGFAAAAFGIFYSSIWMLADALSIRRLLVISLLAIGAMVTWIILYNNLWQPRTELREKAFLYNITTILSLTIGVTAAYVVLFVVTFVGAFTVIEGGYLARALGHPVNLGSYLHLAWLASSMGTFAGALGSSLESEEAVHRAAYSRRERERRARYREEQEKRNNSGKSEQD